MTDPKPKRTGMTPNFAREIVGHGTAPEEVMAQARETLRNTPVETLAKMSESAPGGGEHDVKKLPQLRQPADDTRAVFRRSPHR